MKIVSTQRIASHNKEAIPIFLSFSGDSSEVSGYALTHSAQWILLWKTGTAVPGAIRNLKSNKLEELDAKKVHFWIFNVEMQAGVQVKEFSSELLTWMKFPSVILGKSWASEVNPILLALKEILSFRAFTCYKTLTLSQRISKSISSTSSANRWYRDQHKWKTPIPHLVCFLFLMDALGKWCIRMSNQSRISEAKFKFK